ncbi:MAG TPA: hypothetical protein VLX56_03840 [Nitrososphaerales archaeon]|nr:hypothetical protein [Nitrososphaerales archaeon]
MLEIVRDLKPRTAARIALCSMPPWGEDLQSEDPFQEALNKGFAEHDAVMREIASAGRVGYIPSHERCASSSWRRRVAPSTGSTSSPSAVASIGSMSYTRATTR